jgi:7-carboxy-7-deazaguanine synthase
MSIDEVLAQVRAFDCQLVEVTGGEPLTQRECFGLITRLCDEGYEVLIETGGYVSTAEVDERASLILDVKCPASGEAERNHWPNLERLRAGKDEIKFVVADKNDWNFARDVIARYDLERRARAVLISPAWDQIALPALANWITDAQIHLGTRRSRSLNAGIEMSGKFDFSINLKNA